MTAEKKQGRGHRKQITFDLSQKALAEHYPCPELTVNPRYYKKAYSDISCFMKKNGFEHRQFSVYTSKKKLSEAEIITLIDEMAYQMPWLLSCVNQIDVTNIGSQHSLLQTLEMATTVQIEQSVLEPEPVELKVAPQPDMQAIKARIIAAAEREAAELRAQKPEAPARGQHR